MEIVNKQNVESLQNVSPLDSGESSGANQINSNKNTNLESENKEENGTKAPKIKENQFPVEVFPPLFKNVIIETSKALNFPIDYSAATILVAMSTAIGKTAKLRVKNGWEEFCPLYMGLVGNAGASKSHPLDKFTEVLKEIDMENLNIFKPLMAEYETYMSMPANERRNAKAVVEPILVKTLMSNFTPEILNIRIADNPRSVCVVSEELESWLLGMNNYSKSDQSSTYLSMWSVKRTDVDRVSQQNNPTIIERPFISIIGTCQPRKLSKMFPVDKCDSGFLQRFLWAFPVDSDKKCLSNIELDEKYLLEYNRWIRSYIKNNVATIKSDGQPNAKIYPFSKEAKAYFLKWQSVNTQKVNNAGDSLLSEELNKFDIHFMRFALILEIMADNGSNAISLKSVEGAAKLCSYFEYTMKMVLNKLDRNNTNDLDVTKLVKLLNSKGVKQQEISRIIDKPQGSVSRILNS